jgi:hypothetical protein
MVDNAIAEAKKAIARLQPATPPLLAALREIAEADEGATPDTDYFTIYDDCRIIALAAIAEATAA